MKENVASTGNCVTPPMAKNLLVKNNESDITSLFDKDWLVEEDGSMYHRKQGYEICAKDLKNDDWISHLLEKGWCDMNTFLPAYFYALSKVGVSDLSIKIEI